MKKIMLGFTFFIISLFIATPTLAAVTKSTPVLPVAISQPVMPKIDYNLPYPGLLPDSPLYFLKQLRDKILEFLIADPVRKIEFYLLQADKRLGMGMTLIDKGKNTLAETTISKGTKYMNLAVSLLTNVKAGGKMIPGEVVDRLATAIGKHIEVLESLISKASGTTGESLKGSLILLQDLAQQVRQLK